MTRNLTTPSATRVKFAFYALTFVAGFASVALETLGFRLMAPRFGTAVSVSTGVVGIVLIGLAFGYSIGGKLVDRSPRTRPLLVVVLASGLWILAIIPFGSLLDTVARLPSISGVLLGATLVLGPPTLGLAMVCPYVVRLTSVRSTAESAGVVYAISTVGSLVGVFVMTFGLMPFLGVRSAIAVLALGLVVGCALCGIATRLHDTVGSPEGEG